MKNLILLAAACASLSLAACTTDGVQTLPSAPPAAPVPSGNTAISAAAQRALFAAESAYNVPAQAYITLNRRGALSPALKAKTKPLLQQAYQALKIARQAAAAGDTVGVMFQTSETQRLANVAAALLPK